MIFNNTYFIGFSHKLFLVLFISGIGMAAMAQTPADTTLNRTVIVEHEYDPEIMDARKINVLPEIQEITVSPDQVEYDGHISPATDIPGAPLSAFAAKEIQESAGRGYARAGYGNYGNADARFNYLFLLSPKDKLNVSFGLDGMDGKLDLPDTREKWKSHYYRTRAGLNYMHQFKQVDMDLSGRFGLSNFNFLPDSPFNRQKFTSGDIHLGVISTGDNLPVRFNAETNVFMYERSFNNLGDAGRGIESLSETLIRTKADASGELSEDQFIGLLLEINNRFYNHDGMKNINSVLVRPYYEWKNENLTVHLGVNADMAFGLGKKFFVSPDVKLDYVFADSYVLYAAATGGRLMNDFRRLEEYNPYGLIGTQRWDTYEQINGVIGFKASPVTGFWFNLYGGYQDLKDDLYVSRIGHYFYQTSTNNLYGGIRLSYDYKDFFSVSTGGQYYNWDTKENELINGITENAEALYMKPELRFDFYVNVRPVKQLNFGIGYRYEKRTENAALRQRENAINDLHAHVHYYFYKGISGYVRMSNLLNKDYSYFQGYQNQGINFLGGVSFSF